MHVAFSTNKLAKLCNSEKKLRGEFGPRMASLIQQRLLELHAADVLDDMRFLPGARCHELQADRSGQLAVDLVHPKRLIFQPDHEPIPTREDGGLDWNVVTAIVVIEIVDYH
ncbi:MAG: killer suppression protein [Planctomycetota bacterium]|nr:killer suppression protein [Planctomycetota bacterium]